MGVLKNTLFGSLHVALLIGIFVVGYSTIDKPYPDVAWGALWLGRATKWAVDPVTLLVLLCVMFIPRYRLAFAALTGFALIYLNAFLAASVAQSPVQIGITQSCLILFGVLLAYCILSILRRIVIWYRTRNSSITAE